MNQLRDSIAAVRQAADMYKALANLTSALEFLAQHEAQFPAIEQAKKKADKAIADEQSRRDTANKAAEAAEKSAADRVAEADRKAESHAASCKFRRERDDASLAEYIERRRKETEEQSTVLAQRIDGLRGQVRDEEVKLLKIKEDISRLLNVSKQVAA